MSLTTPEKIRTLQRKLYRKAKAEPTFRFYLLYDKIYREDILRHAYELARANAGAAGVDGMTFARIETLGLEAWLAGLREELVSKTYRPDPVRRVSIPKADGVGERLLGIPTIRDRVVQTAAKLVLEPVFEADFEDTAYGYRPARGAADAVKEVHRRAIGASCTGVAHGVFTLLWFSGRSVFYSFDACSFSHRRGPYDEAGRKAGCRKSARPV
jgi:RNA-directed DNA polymerase